MHLDAPRTGRAADVSSSLARGLALFTLVGLTSAFAMRRGTPAPALERPSAAVRYDVAPDGDWLVVWQPGRGAEIARAWLVSVDDGTTRELDDAPIAPVEPNWDEQGRLRLQVVDRTRGVQELRWIDVATDQVVESTRDRERMKSEMQSEHWARLGERKLADGRTTKTVSAPALGRDFEFSARGVVDCQVSQRPGVVFIGIQNGNTLELAQHDLATDTTQRFARLDSNLVSWTVSDSGDGVLLIERGTERRARVIDTSSGMLLHGPWLADEAAWIEGAAGRYVGLTRGRRKLVCDVLRDRVLELAAAGGEWPRVVALADGRFVLEQSGRIELCDENLEALRILFDGGQPRVASK